MQLLHGCVIRRCWAEVWRRGAPTSLALSGCSKTRGLSTLYAPYVIYGYACVH